MNSGESGRIKKAMKVHLSLYEMYTKLEKLVRAGDTHDIFYCKLLNDCLMTGISVTKAAFPTVIHKKMENSKMRF